MLRKATPLEKVRKWIYDFSYIIVALVSIVITIIIQVTENMDVIIANSVTIAIAGAGMAAFIFTMQSILLSVPKDNPFMTQIRKDGHYLIYIHRFCRLAEISFMLIFMPMIFVNNERQILAFIAISIFIGAMVLTIWSMYLMGKILIFCEKHVLD